MGRNTVSPETGTAAVSILGSSRRRRRCGRALPGLSEFLADGFPARLPVSPVSKMPDELGLHLWNGPVADVSRGNGQRGRELRRPAGCCEELPPTFGKIIIRFQSELAALQAARAKMRNTWAQ